jgi:hypothetical protein
LEVPLSVSMHEEKLIWKKERNGIYSVQSGYNLVMRDILSNASSCVEGNWNSMRRVHAPPKTRHHLWRICRGCMPSSVVLAKMK